MLLSLIAIWEIIGFVEKGYRGLQWNIILMGKLTLIRTEKKGFCLPFKNCGVKSTPVVLYWITHPVNGIIQLTYNNGIILTP